MRLNGGEFLLNLLVLGALTISSESVTITDESVIKQLTGLKEYIDNQRSIKPLYVKFNDGSEIIVAKGEVRKFIDDTDFILYAKTKTSSIEINVSFTQRVNANNDPIDDYYIADGDATLTFTNEVQIFENIVDKDGHPRFIEGDLQIESVSGVTQKFGKWSLSGTHLMIVLAIESEAQTIPYTDPLVFVNLPDWINNKIYTIITGGNYIATENISWYAADNTTQSGQAQLRKNTQDKIYITLSSITLDKVRATRIAFDLLIDNESSEDAGE